MAKEFVNLFSDIELVDLPIGRQERFGSDQFQDVQELQVGIGNTESRPKVMRVSSDGFWMGQRAFVKIPNEPVNNSNIKYQIDMQGNVTATSFKTAGLGKRVRIINNTVQIFDSNNKLRLEMNGDTLSFYGEDGITLIGSIASFSSPDQWVFNSPADVYFLVFQMFINATNIHSIFINSQLFQAYSAILDAITCYKPFAFAILPADPPGFNGLTYYNSVTDELRTFKAGTWRDVITT